MARASSYLRIVRMESSRTCECDILTPAKLNVLFSPLSFIRSKEIELAYSIYRKSRTTFAKPYVTYRNLVYTFVLYLLPSLFVLLYEFDALSNLQKRLLFSSSFQRPRYNEYSRKVLQWRHIQFDIALII